MLRGWFGDTSGRPFLEGRLFIPRLGLRSDISFLVDTGSDKTTLLPADALRMGIDYALLQASPVPAVGIGGTSRTFVEPAVAVFDEPGVAIYAYRIELEILAPGDDALATAPSLLGRDILRHWLMRYSPPTNRLTFRVPTPRS